MHYEVLDEKRRALLPALDSFKKDFYLAGGTALALQIGHRISIDFDFFTEANFSTEDLYEQIHTIFGQVPRTQESSRTLAVIVHDDVRLSFIGYRYPLLAPCVEIEYLRLASMADIGCMKLNAIVSRAELKDYADLYFILKQRSLQDLLADLAKKIPSLDQNLVLKALVSFTDVSSEPIAFVSENEVTFAAIQQTIIEQVKTVSVGIRASDISAKSVHS